jgi:tRNA G18 (ribose-2'-O)-methylase SpoU
MPSSPIRKLSWDEIQRPSPDALDGAGRHPVRGLIHNVRSIHNVGSMFRTSDAARVEHLHLSGFTGTPEHEDLQKTALGAQDTVPWSHHGDGPALVGRLQDAGFTVAALEITNAPTAPSSLSLDRFPLCIAVGNEVRGLDEDVLAASGLALEVPQFGAKLSLNVSVAYGIALYDAVRRYRSLQGLPPAADGYGAGPDNAPDASEASSPEP